DRDAALGWGKHRYLCGPQAGGIRGDRDHREHDGSPDYRLLRRRVAMEILPVAAVLALLGGALWFLRRKGIVRGGGRQLAILERLTLTPQHTLCLVRVGEETLLIGTAPSTLQVLSGAGTRACRFANAQSLREDPGTCPQECRHGRHECLRHEGQ